MINATKTVRYNEPSEQIGWTHFSTFLKSNLTVFVWKLTLNIVGFPLFGTNTDVRGRNVSYKSSVNTPNPLLSQEKGLTPELMVGK